MATSKIKPSLIGAIDKENVLLTAKTVSLAGKTTNLTVKPQMKRAALGDVGNHTTLGFAEPSKPVNKAIAPDKIAPVARKFAVPGRIAEKKCEKSVQVRKTVTEKTVALKVTSKANTVQIVKPLASIGNVKRPVVAQKTNVATVKESIKEKTTIKKNVVTSDKTSKAEKETVSSKDPTEDKLTDLDRDTLPGSKDRYLKSFSAAALEEVLNSNDIEDIYDKNDPNPLAVTTYVLDIYSYLYELEGKYCIKPGFLSYGNVNYRMRTVLVDWLIDVHRQFKLLQETLYLTVSILDRYLQINKTITRSNLQLLGMAAMLVASKYEEMYAPEVSDFEYMADHTYSKVEILAMERNVLKTLNFNLGQPLPVHFLRMFSKAANATPLQYTLSKYLMEICVLDYNLCYNKPSAIAAAALYISRSLVKVAEEEVWSATVRYYSRYSEKSILPLAQKVTQVLGSMDTSKYKAIGEKYAQAKYCKVSTLPQLKKVGTLFKVSSAKTQ